MRGMKRKHITRLEEHLEQFIEGAFASLFGKRIRAHDIALQLARAMEDGCKPPQGADPRTVAPDQYTIHANVDVQKYLLEQYPQLSTTLSEHLVELATQNDYRLSQRPMVKILAEPEMDTNEIRVTASHSSTRASSTAAMQPIQIPQATHPVNAQLVINDTRTIPLNQDLINIGRHPDNHIILDDPTVSRHHLQIRLRLGQFMMFDVRSRTGTLVNGNRTKEHILRSGDIIRIGRTQIVYMQEDGDYIDDDDQNTDAFDPL